MNHHADRHADRGATTIFVVLAMPVLILAGALVFDGGRGIVARRETQNAADAGALAKATDCAKKSVPPTDFDPYQTNGATLGNAPICNSNGTTTVSMKKTITFAFRPGGGTADVVRSATAKWVTIGSATTTPIVMSSCEFTQALLDGNTDVMFYLDDTKPQNGCSSLPGGFSQLRSINCDVAVVAGGSAAGDPGADVQKLLPCITNASGDSLPRFALISIYDAVACQAIGCKGNGQYPILGFAMLRVTGYTLNGNNYAGTGMTNNCPDSTRGKYCIRGDYVPFVTSGGVPGPSINFGLVQVALTLDP